MRILVLEDNDDRITAMRDVIADRFGQYAVSFFKSCDEMKSAITQDGLADVVAIALDHDLEMIPGPEGRMVDPGTGVEMAEWLKDQSPKCSVVVHTTNTRGGIEMVRLLRKAGWRVERVVPYDGESWIATGWFSLIRTYILESERPNRHPSFGLAWLAEMLATQTSFEERMRLVMEEYSNQLFLAVGRPGLSIELLTLRNDRWEGAVMPGPLIQSLNQFVNPKGVTFEELSPLAGVGPVTANDPRLSTDFSDALAKSGVHRMLSVVLSTDTPEPSSSLIVISSRSQEIKLNEPSVHATLMDLVACLKILLSVEQQSSPLRESIPDFASQDVTILPR